jgi:hypothetical protein
MGLFPQIAIDVQTGGHREGAGSASANRAPDTDDPPLARIGEKTAGAFRHMHPVPDDFF